MKENITPLHGNSPKFTREVFEDDRYEDDIDDDDELDLDEEPAALPERKRRDNVAVSGFGGGNKLPAGRHYGGPTLQQHIGKGAHFAAGSIDSGFKTYVAYCGETAAVLLFGALCIAGTLTYKHHHPTFKIGTPASAATTTPPTTTAPAEPKNGGAAEGK